MARWRGRDDCRGQCPLDIVEGAAEPESLAVYPLGDGRGVNLQRLNETPDEGVVLDRARSHLS